MRRRGSSPLRVTIAVNNDSAFKQSLAEFLAQCLESLGVTVTVDAMPWESYQSALASGQFDLYLGEVRMTGDFDPGELLTGSLNYGGYASQTMTELLSAWRGARGAARDRAASALWQAFAREAPIAPLCFKRGSLLVRWGMVTGGAAHPGRPLLEHGGVGAGAVTAYRARGAGLTNRRPGRNGRGKTKERTGNEPSISMLCGKAARL